MELHIAELGTASKVSLVGRLDTPGVDQIETRFLAGVTPAGRHTLVDLSEVSFISSMGIRMLLGAARALSLKKAKMVLYGAQPMVAASLEQTIKAIVPLAPDEAAALDLLR